jgi:hypothetical protein
MHDERRVRHEPEGLERHQDVVATILRTVLVVGVARRRSLACVARQGRSATCGQQAGCQENRGQDPSHVRSTAPPPSDVT